MSKKGHQVKTHHEFGKLVPVWSECHPDLPIYRAIKPHHKTSTELMEKVFLFCLLSLLFLSNGIKRNVESWITSHDKVDNITNMEMQ